jgi:hypothetical protein
MKKHLPIFLLLLTLSFGTSILHADTFKVKRQIVLPDGKPAGGARVLLRTLKSEDGSLLAEKYVTADEAGMVNAQIESAPRSVNDEIRVTGYLMVDVPGTALAFEKFSNLRVADLPPLKLGNGYEIKGKVLDEARQPIAGARVMLAGFTSNWGTWRINWPSVNIATPEAITNTGGDGTYQLRSVDIIEQTFGNGPPAVRPLTLATVSREDITLIGREESFARRIDGNREASARPENVIRVMPCRDVRGRVVSAIDARPVAGASMRLRAFPGDDVSAMIAPTTTNADGTFEWKGVPYSLLLFTEARHADYAMGYAPILPQNKRAGTSQEPAQDPVTVQVRPLATISGRIVDVQTNAPPITPIGITGVYEEGFNDGRIAVGRGVISARMNANGTFTIRAPIGWNHFMVRGPGYWEGGRAHPIDLDVKPGHTSDQVLQVRRENGFLVHFTSSLAKANAKFNFDAEFDLMMRGKDGKVSSTNWGEWWYYSLYNPDDELEISVTRFADGFLQEVVPWTKLTPWRDAAGNAKHWPRLIALPERQTITVRGKVLAPNTNKPIAGAAVSLISRPAAATDKLAPVISGPDGTFVFGKVPLPTELMIKATPPTAKGNSAFLHGWTRVGKSTLTPVVTAATEGHQELTGLVVLPRVLEPVNLQFVDAETGSPIIAECTITVKGQGFTPLKSPDNTDKYIPESQMPLTDDFILQNVPVSPPGSLMLQLPHGTLTLSMEGPYALPEEAITLSVTQGGIKKRVIKVRSTPTLVLHFIRDNPDKVGRIMFKFESVPGTTERPWSGDFHRHKWDGGNDFFFSYSVPGWGSKWKLTVIDAATRNELFSGIVTPDPKTWPTKIHLGQKLGDG